MISHPLHPAFAEATARSLRRVEQSPGLFLISSAPIKGEDLGEQP